MHPWPGVGQVQLVQQAAVCLRPESGGLLQVGGIRTAFGYGHARTAVGVFAHESRTAEGREPLGVQEVAKLYQGILVVAVAIDHHRNGDAVFRPQAGDAPDGYWGQVPRRQGAATMQMALRTEMGVSAGSVVRSISSRRAMRVPSAMARAIFIEVCVGEKQATQKLV